ncbi:hypothetical protein ACTFIZ_000781 [Dictyostelium cf. discoideum]
MLKSLNFINRVTGSSLSKTRNFTSQVNKETWDKYVVSNKKPVVIDFFATWCPPCKQLEPVLVKAVEDYGKCELYKYDISEEEGFHEKFGIQSIPHVIGFHNNKIVFEFKGAIPASQVKKHLEKFDEHLGEK